MSNQIALVCGIEPMGGHVGVGGLRHEKESDGFMESSIRQVYWGARTESGLVGAWVNTDPYRVLSERVQQALSTVHPEARLCGLRVVQEERMIDGLVCQGYHITVEVSVTRYQEAHNDMRALECSLEGLLSVSMLDVLTPIHVDLVSSVP